MPNIAVKQYNRLPRLLLRHIFHGTSAGGWRSVLPVNRFIYILDGGQKAVIYAPEKFEYFSDVTPLVEHFSKFPCRNFTVTEMAAFMKMEKESFSKRFTEATGTAPKTFFNDLRAAAIARELLNSPLTIQEISEKFGFSNEFYFSRFFKRRHNQPPREFRKNDPEYSGKQ